MQNWALISWEESGIVLTPVFLSISNSNYKLDHTSSFGEEGVRGRTNEGKFSILENHVLAKCLLLVNLAKVVLGKPVSRSFAATTPAYYSARNVIHNSESYSSKGRR